MHISTNTVVGRTSGRVILRSIVKGEAPAQPGVPESFKVLIKELQALGLSVDLLKKVEDGGHTPSASADKTEEAKAEAPEETGAAK